MVTVEGWVQKNRFKQTVWMFHSTKTFKDKFVRDTRGFKIDVDT